MVSVPPVDRLPAPSALLYSVTAPVEEPPMTGVSLVPPMVTVIIWLLEPSLETAVKESVMVAPAASCWIAFWLFLAAYVQLPSVPIDDMPQLLLPGVAAWIAKLDWP